MTPPPMTTMDLGSSFRLSAPVESMQLGLSLMPGMGGTEFAEPVARIYASASSGSSVPSFSERSSSWRPGSHASPSILILLAFSRLAIPLVSFLRPHFVLNDLGEIYPNIDASTPIAFPAP